MHAFVGPQGFPGAVRVGGTAHVQLHHFICVHRADVAHLQHQLVSFYLCLSVGKGGIAEAEAEGEQRLSLEETIGASFHGIVLKIGQLLHVLIEGDGQFPGRRYVAKEHIRDGRTSFLSGIPGLQDGVAGLGFRLQAHGTAGEIHQHHFFAGIMQGLQQMTLYFRQFDALAVPALESGQRNVHLLPFQLGRNAAGEHHDIVLIQAFGTDIVTNQLATFIIDQVLYAFLQGIQQGDAMLRNRVVIAPEHFAVVGVGPHQGDARLGVQRQYIVPVLQKDDAFLRHLQRQRTVLLPFHDLVRKRGPGLHVPVQFSQANAGGKQALQAAVYVFLVQ